MFNDRFLLKQAVMHGIKRQTRRMERLNEQINIDVKEIFREYYNDRIQFRLRDAELNTIVVKPRYNVGEVVAVAQSYEYVYADMIIDFAMHNYHLSREDSAEKFRKQYEQTKGWMNKMFVKPELMPHQIRITNVRVQRLKEITDEECLLEGVFLYQNFGHSALASINDTKEEEVYRLFDTVREAYAFMIDAISGKGTWDSNPYVFVYDFELVK